MSMIIADCSAALVASSRPRLSLVGERPYATDAQPRLRDVRTVPAVMAWRGVTATARGFEPAAHDGRDAFTGAGSVTTTHAAATEQQHLIRSGPPTCSP